MSEKSLVCFIYFYLSWRLVVFYLFLFIFIFPRLVWLWFDVELDWLLAKEKRGGVECLFFFVSTWLFVLVFYFLFRLKWIMTLLNVLTRLVEPGSAPKNVQVRPLSSTTMVIQWEEPDTPNGQVIVSADAATSHFLPFFIFLVFSFFFVLFGRLGQ